MQKTKDGSTEREALAIVGIGCRFPGGVEDTHSFWEMLTHRQSGIVEVPEGRWAKNRYYHPDTSIPRRMHTKWGGFLHSVDQFDAQFWGISPREALRMDPQQRWLLECSWESLEDAGIQPSKLRGTRTGVYVGIASNEYAQIQTSAQDQVDVHTNSGATLSIASNRIAYLLDLKGPAMSVDTACSSALVAINIGCKDMWSGEIDQALVGGVNALLTPDTSIGFSKATMLSPSGQCFAFDDRANGYVRGEGAGMMVIKPLSKAVEDGDRIYATVRAAVINQDGNTSSMTVPGQDTQEVMLVQAYEEAGMSPGRVNYMEAHGTGTPVGDPIETNALGNVLSRDRPAESPCLIGSVKTNVGHLESGSGAAGMIKAALVLKHGQVPPNLNFKRPNPNIDFDGLKLKVVTENTPLKSWSNEPPVAAVNSFGFGGTNAHIVLEAPPEQEFPEAPTEKAERPYLLPISGREETALRNYAVKYRSYLEDPELDLAEVCYSAGARKEQHDRRAVILGKNVAELREKLRKFSRGDDYSEGIFTGTAADEQSPVVFVFTGQGAQWWKMGQELLEREPVFRQTIEAIDAEIRKLGDWSLLEEMTRSEEDSNINRTYIAQPAIFALQVALAELWKSLGVVPDRVVGHSVGEVAAAYVAGAYTLEDAVKVIFHRSRLQENTGGDGNKGRMYAVGLSEADGKKAIKGIEDQVQVAVVNSPTMITIAGDREPLEELAGKLEKEGKFVRQLRINYAFHTHQMEPIKDELLEALKDIQPRRTKIPFISTVTGGGLRGEELDAMYWWRNVREAVLFAPAMNNLIRGGERLFLELGPHPALQSPINECLQDQKRKGAVFYSLKRKEDETMEILTNLAGLHNHGVEVDWKGINQAAGRFVPQPSYPWTKETFWLESEEGYNTRCNESAHPLLGIRARETRMAWEFQLDPRLFPFLDDHRFWDSVIFPAAGYGEIGLAVAKEVFPDEDYCVEELEARKALFISESRIPTVRVVFDDKERTFEVFSNASGSGLKEWELNACGRIRKLGNPEFSNADFEEIRERMDRHYTHEQYYSDYEEAGYQFGPNFQHLENVWRRDHESLAEVVVPEGVLPTLGDFYLHPAVLDAFFHAVKGAQVIPEGARGTDYFYLPAAIGRIRMLTDKVPERMFAHANIYFDDRESLISNIMVYDENGTPIVEIAGFRVDRMDQKDEKQEEVDNSFYQFQWEPRRLKGSRADGTPGFAPIPEVLTSVRSEVPQVYEDFNLSIYYKELVGQLEEVVLQQVVNAFHKMGWDLQAGDQFTFEEIATRLGVIETHHRLLGAHLDNMTEHGWLKSIGDRKWELVTFPDPADTDSELEHLHSKYKPWNPEIELQMITGPVLAEVLTGEEDPVEVLFPQGSSRKLERFYREGADFPANNLLIEKALEKVVADMPERRALRVLEVGAGTGSLTRAVLPALSLDRVEYTFTDNGPKFLADAKKAFSDYPFMEFTTFDIERDPEEQGLNIHGYDLILGTNVVHATSDLKNTLGNLTKCLSEDGLLMFLEVTQPRTALNNVFGLLKGWWYYQDTDLRPNSALMGREEWVNLLSDVGYRDVGYFISSEISTEAMQAVFLGKAPVLTAAEEAPATPEEVPAVEDEEALNTFVVFADESGVSSRLAAELVDSERLVVTVKAGDAFLKRSESEFTINPAELGDWEAMFNSLGEAGHRVTNLIHLWTLDHPAASDLGVAELQSIQTTGVGSLRQIFHALHGGRVTGINPDLLVVTRGRVSVGGEPLHNISAAPITGFCRVASNEFSNTSIRMIDLDPAGSDFEASDLFEEIVEPDGELEISYRKDLRQVSRLHRVRTEEVPMLTAEADGASGKVVSYRLEIDKPGVLQNLTLNETPRFDPGEGEIEIQVKAGGINFRDVMKALGMYPGNPVDIRWFGDDISGTVVRVGPGVTDLKPGDNVVGMAPYAFRSYVTVHRNLVFRKPDHLSFEEGATLPTVFLTSHYALVHLARMQKGERVLIHAGTGGVGQAAIQIAQKLGLEIFSTAGTEEKRQLLRDMGVHHVMNSRTLDFADDIFRITNGEGVDCVLNSLSADFIPKSFQCLRRFGRFIEIGKIDVYGNSKLGMEMLKNNISWFVVDLAQHLESRPDYVASMLRELEDDFYAKTYTSLPKSVFPITDVVEAFRFMAQGKHIGKNVLNFDVPSIQVGPCTQEGHLFKADGTYLITGGAGGFGFELACWMVDNGARNLALVSRSGPAEEIQARIAGLEAGGASVLDCRADVTDGERLKAIVSDIQASGQPLRGVIHGAMVINDLDILDLDEEGFNKVVNPKMLGAWNLHQLTLDIPLDFFVSFSSFSTVIGAVRQSNYNAGNAFLDAISQHRNALGMPSLTFNWGALGGAGFVDRNEKTAQYLDMLGMKIYQMDETLSIFGRFLPRRAVNLAASRIDWNSLKRFSPLVGSSPTYSLLAQDDNSAEGGAIRSQIIGASADARSELVVEFIAEQVAGVFGTDVTKIDRDTPLNQIGLDSLMAIELMNRIEAQLGISVPMGSVLNGPNIRELAVPILESLIESAGGEIGEGEAGDSTAVTSAALPVFEISEEEGTEFPLTEGQKALWFLHQLAPESPAYNLVYCAKITPLVDIENMKAAFRSLFERHPMLDVTFHTVDGQPVQRVHKGRTVDFREHDVTQMSDAEIKELTIATANQPFDLRNGPVVRLDLFRTANDEHITLMCMHHIVSDAWSVTLFMNDLIESYFSRRMGKTPEWEPIESRYFDYVQWEQKHLAGESGNQMLEYWKSHVEGAPLTLDLPTDRPRPAVQTFNGSAYGFRIGPEVTADVLALASEKNVTLFTLLYSAFGALMHRYCNQEDFLIGVPLAGRSQPELHPILGYFVNPVPLRSRTDDEPTFLEYMARNSEATIGALEHQHYPLSRLVDEVKVPRDPARSPMFQVSFSMERTPGMDENGVAVFLTGQGGYQMHVADITVESVDLTLRQAQFEITLAVEEADGQIYGCWQYNADLFDESTIARLNELFEQVLRQVVENPEVKISEMDLLSREESTRVLETWNATTADYPHDQLLHELVIDHVSLMPDKIAVRCSGDTLTFSQLDRRANGLASLLTQAGAGPDKPVALLAHRSCDMVVGTLGILKSGSCYVPMDPEFPAARLSQMLEDSAPGVIVTQRALKDDLPAGDWKVICLEDVQSTDAAPEVTGLTPDSLAYVIYTSGSTGTPKGVEIPHKAAVNFLWSMKDQPGLSESDRLLAVTTLSFDISLLEIYLPLLTGAEAVIATREEVKDGRHLGHMMDEFDVTVMQATPATWRMLIEGGWEGKDDLRILSGGEPLPRDLADRLLGLGAEVWNLYGPTETTVWSTLDRVEAGDGSVSIGKPIANTTIYILDGNLQPVPAGFVGDLYIGGHGLARGYHGQADLTAERFIEVTLPGGATERVYRTGDLGRWNLDGNLECLGRSDFQIKLRGVRMELDDIEANVASHPSVRQAVVIKRDDIPGGENLVAYVTVEGSEEGLVPRLRAHVAERLPESMRPAFYSVIEEFPLTPNLKVDRKRLPAPQIDRSGMETAYVAPQTDSERLLADIFNEAFETEIGIRDNFFDIGGDSLLAVRILAQASETFNRNIPVGAFLQYPTIERLANFLHSTDGEDSMEFPAGTGSSMEELEEIEHVKVKFIDDETFQLPQVDAVALACIPESFTSLTNLTRDELVGQWFENRPRLGSVYELPTGKIGLLILPLTELDMFKDEALLKQGILDALEMAAQMGAKTVSLTGMLPSATDHGREVSAWTQGRNDIPAVTTGDATRTATIIRTMEGALEKSGRSFSEEKVAFVGLGSIGRGTVELTLSVLPNPASVLLADPYLDEDALEAVRSEIVAAGYEGEIEIAANGGGLASAVYDASFIVGTTSIPGILDVNRLAPGTILVDYSFPPSFRVLDAMRRSQEAGDILFTTGGELFLGETIRETIYLPERAQNLSETVDHRHFTLIAGRNPEEITGCVAVSLLTGQTPDVKPTLGPVQKEDVVAHYHHLVASGYQPAHLQMQRYYLDEAQIEKFKTQAWNEMTMQ